MSRVEIDRFEQACEVAGVVSHRMQPKRSGALTVTATVVGQHLEALGERPHERVEVVMVDPRAVDQDHGVARGSGDLVVKRGVPYRNGRHGSLVLPTRSLENVSTFVQTFERL
jgi:hypothetical protein